MLDRRVRHICTADDPWTPQKADSAAHPEAEYLDDRDYGNGVVCESYKCPHCGVRFNVELAQ